MSLDSLPILYSFRRCPYAMRARLALRISGMRYEHREIRLSAKPEAMLAASPKGTVPVLVLPDGEVVDESLAIMRWALAISDPEDWLSRDDHGLIGEIDGGFKHNLDRYKYAARYETDPVTHRNGCVALLQEVEGRLASHGQLCGSRRGMADSAIMPFVRQFAAVDPDWFAAQPLPRLKMWLEHHLASDLFAGIMARFPAWSPGDPRVLPAS